MAAQAFYVHLDLNKQEIQNAAIQNLATPPGSPVEGQIYYDNSIGDKQPYFYNGSSWVAFSSATHPDPHLLGNGSNTAPTYSFSGDPNTGMYNTGVADTLGFTTGGALRFSIDTSTVTSTLPYLAPNGSLSNVAFGFSGDPNTGMYQTGSADTMALVTGGSARLTIDTSTLTSTLPVLAPNGTTSNVAFGFSGDPNTGFYSTGVADTMAWVTGGSARITTNTASITTTLPLLGQNGSAGNPAYSFSGDPDTGVYQTGTANEIGLATNGTNRLTIADTVITVNGIRITGLATPTSASDAVTKSYVDGLSTGVDWKGSVRVATTTTGTLATAYENGDTIDGVVLATGDRILIKDQSTQTENGIYTVNASGAPTRATDADSSAEVTGGMAVWVNEGTANGDSGWILTTNDVITLGSTNLVFTQFTGLGQITAGAGLTKTGNTLDVGGTTNRITVAADSVDIAATYVGQTSITTLGTITTGTWTGTAIAAANGGTGQTTYTIGDILYASSSSALSKLADVATGNALISGGVGVAPSWGQIGLTTHVTGVLPTNNGGTNSNTAQLGTSNQFLIYDGTRITASGVTSATLAATYVAKFSATIGNGSAQTFALTHNFNTKDVVVQVYRTGSPYDTINVEVVRNTVNQVTVNTNNVPTTNEYTVVILGIDG